ncbi:MAG: hypothetical protein A2289_16770 [Deltaproteobacteria bacterium RIFOXYA12_FULL_58_15]|nr:MAG: hypothetical protein A2289_16770 [Deltaproteobacteria bacterium RIFOXYA12_FULL_58_15]OGR13897.1 MAG: hypothetical protein A2341_26770 [Deltaproteobacteria bacterium RIFOXYB12_FULL_58_9]
MLQSHLPLFLVLVVALGLGVFILVVSSLVGPKRPSAVKADAFECGNPPSGYARERFGVKFYLVAILFLVFDIEAVFIYPWAIVFSDSTRGAGTLSPLLVVVEMVVFVGILMIGLAYAWRKGALEWGPEHGKGLETTTAGH